MSRLLTVSAIVLLFSAVLAEPSSARSRWYSQLPDLTEEDADLARNAARVQLKGAEVGTVVSWSNEKSGNSGKVKLLERYQWEGHDCQRVAHLFSIRKDRDHAYEVHGCDIDGQWKWPIPPKLLY